MSVLIDLTGKRFGKLVVLGRAPNDHFRKTRWLCRCDCGKEHEAPTQALRSGATKSCKCGWRVNGASNSRWTGHEGLPGRVWTTILHCARVRGLPVSITIEDAWQLFDKQSGLCALTGVPIVFARLARLTVAEQTASLDRIDSAKGYVPGNVQWVHKALQRMKNAMPEEEFQLWCKRVADHHNTPVASAIRRTGS